MFGSGARPCLQVVWRKCEWLFEKAGSAQAARSAGISAAKVSRIKAEMVGAGLIA